MVAAVVVALVHKDIIDLIDMLKVVAAKAWSVALLELRYIEVVVALVVITTQVTVLLL
jgi:hypothetical protein